MTLKQIDKWCYEHINMRSSREAYGGRCDRYKLTFENGDTYEYLTEWRGDFKKVVTIILNGESESKFAFEWFNFGWREVAA